VLILFYGSAWLHATVGAWLGMSPNLDLLYLSKSLHYFVPIMASVEMSGHFAWQILPCE
jgi:hypothetical protein